MKGNKGCANDTHQSQITTQYTTMWFQQQPNVVEKHEKKKNKQTNGDNRPGQQPRREREIIFKMADFNGNTLTHYNTE